MLTGVAWEAMFLLLLSSPVAVTVVNFRNRANSFNYRATRLTTGCHDTSLLSLFTIPEIKLLMA